MPAGLVVVVVGNFSKSEDRGSVENRLAPADERIAMSPHWPWPMKSMERSA